MPRVQKRCTLRNKVGLHARAAATLVRTLSGFRAEVSVSWQGRTANGRSVLDLLTLGAPAGGQLEIRADGADATAAVEALASVIHNKFDEG